jgi:hypothetical protein
VLNCRSIPDSVWAHARQALLSYFAWRGVSNAEDFAQDTLAAFWANDSYEFEREEDFLRICYAFARRSLMAGRRKEQKHSAEELDPGLPAPAGNTLGLNPAELAIFLKETVEAAQSAWSKPDWKAMANGAREEECMPADAAGANRRRVRRHRARRRLAQLTGWKS